MSNDTRPGLLDRFPALKRLQERVRARQIPVVRQMAATDCGLACLSMVLGYHGREVPLDELRTMLGSNRDGTTARALLAAGRQYGMRGRGVSIDLDRLPFLVAGTILHWRFNHYVVFERMDKRGIHLVDPAMGRRCVTLEQFSQSFTGVALILEPAEGFRAQQGPRRSTYRYVRNFFGNPQVPARIILLSLALQVFALALPVMTGMVADRVVPRDDYHLLVMLGLGLLTLVLFQYLTALIRSHLLLELKVRVDSEMTLGLLEHLVDLPYPFFQVRAAGDLMMRLNITSSVREVLSSSAISGVLDGAMVVFYFLLLFAASFWAGLIVLVLGLSQVLVFLVSRRRQRELMVQNLELDAKNQGYQFQMLSAVQTLKTMGVERQVVQDYSDLFVDVLNVTLARGRLANQVDALTNTLRLASPLVMLIFGAWQVLEKELSLGAMLGLTALASALLVPLSNLVGLAGQLQYLSTYLERINEVLDMPVEQPAGRPGRVLRLDGSVDLDRVTFKYGPMSPPVVQDVSLQVRPGQFVAIVGRSGAGKTTLAHLVLGLYLPTSGRILYNGVDLAELELRSVRNQVGVVLQDSSFFSSTLWENIALGLPGIALEEVIEAARLAQIHDEIMAMPLQYDTPLADRGLSLSGGQRQRLALARALVRKPRLLLLDEATSALDALTESRVQAALASLDCTRFVIAHRLSTVIAADTILVMDEGRLVEMGRHDELIARGGVYARLVEAQLDRRTG